MSSAFALVPGIGTSFQINIANCIELNKLTGNNKEIFNFNTRSFEGMDSLELCTN